MRPLLELRNDLDIDDDRHLRDFRRMSGLVQINNGRHIPGPYTQPSRENWLKRVLEAQTAIRRNPLTPENVRDIELITVDELREIRRIWLTEKHELEDNLPRIFENATGKVFDDAGSRGNRYGSFGAEEIEILRKICGEEKIHFELTRELLSITQQFSSQARRSGLYEALDKAFRRNFYKDENDAFDRAQRRKDLFDSAREGIRDSLVQVEREESI